MFIVIKSEHYDCTNLICKKDTLEEAVATVKDSMAQRINKNYHAGLTGTDITHENEDHYGFSFTFDRAIKYRAYPTSEQQVLFAKTFGCVRFIWNHMLIDAQQFLDEAGTFFVPTPAKYKKEFPFLKEVDSLALANTQLDLKDANKRHLESPKAVGVPRLKSKHRSGMSYTTNNKKTQSKDGKIKNTVYVVGNLVHGLEFMAFIVDHKETYCQTVEFALLFDDYRQANSNWVTAEMREKFLAYIEKNYTPSAEVMKDKRFQSLTYDNAVKQYVYDRSNDATSLDVMLKLLEKFDDSVVVDYLANPTGWEERFAKVLEQSGIWDSFAKEFAEPFVAYLVQARQHPDAFSADPSCWESVCKNLMAAV